MKKILIIDDEPQIRTVLRDILSREGYAVQDAPDGRVGIAMWHKEPADLVLTDIFMPHKDGIETIMELKRSRPQAKIIAMTGGGQIDFPEMGSAAGFLGANGTLEKPFDRGSLLAAIRSVLGEHSPAYKPVASVGDTAVMASE